jgi:hydroxymethylglutaryl-CoA synthase
MEGIVSYGAYIPFHRLPRKIIGEAWGSPGGKGERSVANYDEDPLTMAVAAGLDCLAGIDRQSVDALYMATTSAPYKERLNSTIAASALSLNENARAADFANTLRSGTIALMSALDAIKAGTLKNVLVTASDMRLGAADGDNEQNFGDGGAALLVGSRNVIAELEGSYSLARDFPDKWRSQEDVFVRSWEDRWGMDEGYLNIPLEALAGLFKKCGLKLQDIKKVCFSGPNSRKHSELGQKMGFSKEQVQEPLLESVGDTGSALGLMVFAGALEDARPGDRLLLLNWGNGCDALVFKVTDEIQKLPKRRGIKFYLNNKKVMDNYGKYLRWRELITFEPARRPVRDPVSAASLWRERSSAIPLNGAKCLKCGTPQMLINFSSTRPRVCLECGSKDQFEPYCFADKKGTITSFSHDYLGLSQDPPMTLSVIDFEEGGRGPFDMTDREISECKVGMKVEMTFRKLYYGQGIHNYFWKCKPYRE